MSQFGTPAREVRAGGGEGGEQRREVEGSVDYNQKGNCMKGGLTLGLSLCWVRVRVIVLPSLALAADWSGCWSGWMSGC